MAKIVILDGYTLFRNDIDRSAFSHFGDVDFYERTHRDDVLKRIEQADAILTNKVIIDLSIIKKVPKLKYIGVLATGYNVVDVEAANENGIVVTNIPAYSTNSVAQLVYAHIFNIMNHVAIHASDVKNGNWNNAIDFMYLKTPQIELAKKTIGIVGYGKIGQKVAQIARAFDAEVVFYAPTKKNDLPEGVEQKELDEIFEYSDIVSLNCPLTSDNKGFVNHQLINKMKSDAILINTGRGPLVNEHDLAEALNAGRIRAAGLDVLSTEPPGEDNPLINAKNCFITPHIAWATLEARMRLLNIAINNLKHFYLEDPVNIV